MFANQARRPLAGKKKAHHEDGQGRSDEGFDLRFASQNRSVSRQASGAELYVAMTIKAIKGNDKMRLHLQNLGFVTGESVMLVNKINDNVIIKIKGVSIAISRELAKRIIV